MTALLRCNRAQGATHNIMVGQHPNQIMFSVWPLQAHVAVIEDASQVDAVMTALLRNNKVRGATHNIMVGSVSFRSYSKLLQFFLDRHLMSSTEHLEKRRLPPDASLWTVRCEQDTLHTRGLNSPQCKLTAR